MISGYASNASVLPGGTLMLHVSTTASWFRIAVYRWIGQLNLMWVSAWQKGNHLPPGKPERDWNWPALPLHVPAAIPSGVYIAHFQTADGRQLDLAMDSAAALFVVRSHARSAILYKIPLATYNAYNHAGGGCFYDNPPRSPDPPGALLSFRRPGVGIGGPVFGAWDHYDRASPRQTFAHWDAHFVAWLHRQGYDAAYCTDLDLHADPSLCEGHRLLLSVGHDEYWSGAMRDAVEHFVEAGGNVAFFSANVSWWRIHLPPDAATMRCHQGGPQGAQDHWWPASGAARPEDSLSGLSYRHGGGWWDGPRETGGFVVQDARHWVFAGTGLSDGQQFGHDTLPPLVGYECDGAPLAPRVPNALHPRAHRFGTPKGLHILAAAPLGEGWQERPHREAALQDSPHAAVMSVYTRGGTVFAAGTTDWAQVLAKDHPVVSTITRNVIDRLRGSHASGPVVS